LPRLCVVTGRSRRFAAVVLLEQVDGAEEYLGRHRFLAAYPSFYLQLANPESLR
jgi:hypothetical protein